jgi:hypothetical protein
MSLLDYARQYLARRRTAYIRVFMSSAFGDEVLRDLAKFCRAHQSTFNAEPAVANRLDGRREVWLRIQQHLQLSDDQLWAIYGQPVTIERKDT